MSRTTAWRRGAALALVVGAWAGPPVVGAAVREVTRCTDTVPGGVAGELRRAIGDAANGDVILVPACTITLDGVSGEDGNQTGDLDIGRSVTLRGAGAGLTILDGGGFDRVIHVLPGVTVTVEGLTVRNGSIAGGGGGLLSEGTLIVRLSEITGNRTTGSGGGINAVSQLLLDESTVGDNRAAADGGGIRANGATTIKHSTISGNEAGGVGGGIVHEAALLVWQSTISGNQAAAEGGGIAGAGSLTLLHSTVAANRAGAGGGGLHGFGVPDDRLAARGSIVAGNAAVNCGGNFLTASAGFNLQSDDSCAFSSPTDRSDTDPGLGPLARNGGPTATHGLRPGSPALDRVPANRFCPGTDQRGVARPQDVTSTGPGLCDLGATERRSATSERILGGFPLVDPQ